MAGGNIQNNWINAEEAAEILTKNSGHKVNRQYVRKLVLMGKISTKQIDKRTYLYNRRQVEEYHVRTTVGRRPSKKSEEAAEADQISQHTHEVLLSSIRFRSFAYVPGN